ncbi:hypothetical protein BC938DRAFT_475990 [Jimgerdemannia flammicorona]|uniref:Uncharacterized protein n=1 Tax=Jimgerdemannia flammicorona TaxID=994334 RepID=A0A433QR31_9FUNG|nr:hypothetical protein BC938DRAFT_475990 [Jimgerdemannia flammicorona]
MYCQARGILQLEKTHKAIVPMSFAGQRKHLFDFVVFFQFLLICNCPSIVSSPHHIPCSQHGLLKTAQWISQLREEDDNNLSGVSDLSGGLPPHPLTLNKEKLKTTVMVVLPNSNSLSSPIRQ